MTNLNINSRTLKKVGNGYHFMIPPALVRDTGLLKVDKDYNIIVADEANAELFQELLDLKQKEKFTSEEIEKLLQKNKERLPLGFDGLPNQNYFLSANLAEIV